MYDEKKILLESNVVKQFQSSTYSIKQNTGKRKPIINGKIHRYC